MVSNKESAVIFVDIEEVYSFNEDLVCKFVLNHYTPQDGDRIAMFKLGWKSVKDYIIFEWAPTGTPDTMEHKVIFEQHDLPRSTCEVYQICYISSENVLHGATIPFQFLSEVPKQNKAISSILKPSQTQETIVLSSYEDILRLRRTKRENDNNSQKGKISSRMSKSFTENDQSELHMKCEKQIAELKFQIESLRRTVAMQQNEINVLRYREKKIEKLANRGKSAKSVRELNYDLGELDPIPPFPLEL